MNERIDNLTRATLEHTLASGRDSVLRRLAELDQEWDIDRTLMVNFALAGGVAFTAGITRFARDRLSSRPRKGFLYFFGAQLAFLLLHGTAGWCPPMVLMRRLGIRTKAEIEAERFALLIALGSEASASTA